MLEKEKVRGAPKYIVVVQEGNDAYHPADPWGAAYTVPAKRWFFTANDKTQLTAAIRRHKRPNREMTAYSVGLEKVDI